MKVFRILQKCALMLVMTLAWSGANAQMNPMMMNPSTGMGMGMGMDVESLRRHYFGDSSTDPYQPGSASAIGTDYIKNFDRSRISNEEVVNLINIDPNTRYMLNKYGEVVIDSTYTIMKQRRVFGRDIFSTKNLSFTPNLNVATPTDYKLSAGDEIIIDVWGSAEANYRLGINPDGAIVIPNVGPLLLNDLTISEAEAKIKGKLTKVFGPGSQMKITLGFLKNIRVNVVGEAAMPGTYEMPSLTTLFNVLYAAGGVNDIGSMRDINVYRNSKQIAHLDAYDFILYGDVSKNIRLENNDIITVAPCKNMVYMLGAVKRNMIFEMKPSETLDDAIKYAGGFNGDAYTGSITIYRKDGNRFYVVTVGGEQMASMEMRDGDVVVVGRSVAKFHNRISIEGAVWRPGTYELSDTLRSLTSLIAATGGLRADAFLNRGYIVRTDDGFTSSVMAFDVKKAAAGEVKIDLKPEDRVMIASISEITEFPTVAVYGEVNFRKMPRPGLSSGIDASFNETKSKQEQPYADMEKPFDNTSNPYYDAFNYATTDLSADLMKASYKTTSAMTVALGDAASTEITINILPYRANMSIADAILMAGGLKESASEAKLVVYRRIRDTKATTVPEKTAEAFEFTISKDLSLDDNASKFILEPFDEVCVRRSPAYIVQQKVSVTGEVLFAGDYVLVNNDQRLSDIVKEAGGLNRAAYARGATITRQKNADELRRDLAVAKAGFNKKNEADPAELAALSSDKTNASLVTALTKRKKEFDPASFKPEPTYQVGIDLEAALKKPGSKADVVLRDGDVISIPKQVSTVKISGAVAYPTAITYNSTRTKYYINNAGGYAQEARRKPYVVYMNGSVMPASRAKVEPGCEVVVPTKVYDPNKMNGLAITNFAVSIFSSVALVAVTVISIIRK